MEDFIGEIRYFAFNYVPMYWLECDGRTMNINQYAVLFSVIGKAFGGDGTQNFKIPDLRGRAGLMALEAHTPPYRQGEVYGSEAVMLKTGELPAHTHQQVRPGGFKGFNQKFSTPSSTVALGALALVGGNVNSLVTTGVPNAVLSTVAVTRTGDGQAHDNYQPYQVFKAGICYEGVYPTRP